mmetsp:Transcript_24655/g.67068  ORF Transcript_24655/g.67068 Transcript_24655/m.67068 type:complete len:228 (-) Transcript_24655:473-1156(-)
MHVATVGYEVGGELSAAHHIRHREEEGEVLHGAVVALEEEEIAVQLRIKQRKVVEGVGTPEHLGQEEGSQRHVEENALVRGLGEHGPDELVECPHLGHGVARGGVGVDEALRCGSEEELVWSAGGTDHLDEVLLHDALANARLLQALVVEELHAQRQLERRSVITQRGKRVSHHARPAHAHWVKVEPVSSQHAVVRLDPGAQRRQPAVKGEGEGHVAQQVRRAQRLC